MSLLQVENDEIKERVYGFLSQTRYACSELTPLSGGSANFVFRGVLRVPVSSSASEEKVEVVIVKYSAAFLFVARAFSIDLSRCTAEASMLRALHNTTTNLPFKTPQLYLFDKVENIQVHQYFAAAANLEQIFASQTLSPAVAERISYDIGVALWSFHKWASHSAQTGLRAEIWKNEPMRRLKYRTSYASLVGVLENFPGLIEGCRGQFEDLTAMAAGEFNRVAADTNGDANWGVIHGDFWAGNVLLENIPSDSEHNTHLVIIDWELAQFGHRAYDLGQMIGDLCEKKFLDKASGAVAGIAGFVRGYCYGHGGEMMDDEFAFRVAIHAGVHFIHWYIRRRECGSAFTADEIVDAMTLGRDYILKGWEKDKAWFLGTALAPLFTSFCR